MTRNLFLKTKAPRELSVSAGLPFIDMGSDDRTAGKAARSSYPIFGRKSSPQQLTVVPLYRGAYRCAS
jgi:hypothetical protein